MSLDDNHGINTGRMDMTEISQLSAMSNTASAIDVDHHHYHSYSPSSPSSSRSHSNEHMHHDHVHLAEWTEKCKNALIFMETNNIQIRALRWRTMVNLETQKLHHILRLDYSQQHEYEFAIHDPSLHLQFLIEWKGLKINQIKTSPKSYLDFEQKAKSWLNGRRAPNYGKTLFPAMVHSAEKFAAVLADRVCANQKNAHSLYKATLMYAYLCSLCSARVLINHLSNKTYFLCENSVKSSKSETCKILQKYATDHPYPTKFPAHRKEACDYFQRKYQQCLQKLASELNIDMEHTQWQSSSAMDIEKDNLSASDKLTVHDHDVTSLNPLAIKQVFLHQTRVDDDKMEDADNQSMVDNQQQVYSMSVSSFDSVLHHIEQVKTLQLQQESYIHALAAKLQTLEQRLTCIESQQQREHGCTHRHGHGQVPVAKPYACVQTNNAVNFINFPATIAPVNVVYSAAPNAVCTADGQMFVAFNANSNAINPNRPMTNSCNTDRNVHVAQTDLPRYGRSHSNNGGNAFQ